MGGPRNFRYDLLGDTGTFQTNCPDKVVLLAEKVQEIAPVGSVNISETAYEQVKDYHGFNFATKPEGNYNGMGTYVLKAFDDRLATHGSDFDLSAPLKSAQAAQEAAKAGKTGSTLTGATLARKATSITQNMAGAPSIKRPSTAVNRAALAAGMPLKRDLSFNTLNAEKKTPSSSNKD